MGLEPFKKNLKREVSVDDIKKLTEIPIRKISKFDLNKARDRAHLLIGLGVAIANVDNVIEIIKKSKDPADAKRELLKTKWKNSDIADLLAIVDDPRQIKNDKDIYLTEDQAKSILELRLQRLTALGKGELEEELKVLSVNINEYLSILRDKNKLQSVIKDELDNIKQEFSRSEYFKLLYLWHFKHFWGTFTTQNDPLVLAYHNIKSPIPIEAFKMGFRHNL